MISFLRRLLTRQPSELEQMRRNRDYWREAAIAATEHIECQKENVACGMRMVEKLREETRDYARMLCVATARLKESGHAMIVSKDESCCDACDRAATHWSTP